MNCVPRVSTTKYLMIILTLFFSQTFSSAIGTDWSIKSRWLESLACRRSDSFSYSFMIYILDDFSRRSNNATKIHKQRRRNIFTGYPNLFRMMASKVGRKSLNLTSVSNRKLRTIREICVFNDAIAYLDPTKRIFFLSKYDGREGRIQGITALTYARSRTKTERYETIFRSIIYRLWCEIVRIPFERIRVNARIEMDSR